MIISGGIFEKINCNNRIKNLENEIIKENFWKDKQKAQKIVKEKNYLSNIYNSYLNSKTKFNDLKDYISIGQKENDLEILKDCSKNIAFLKTEIKKIEVECFLSDENDFLNTYLEIHAGAGGTESQDWASMLRRMYMKWAESKNFKNIIISEHKGEEAGIKSCIIKISGPYAFGWLKSESGVHRLVRISPFDSGARRHTSFASVWIFPEIDDTINVEIKEKDLRVDTYRSSGAGGQHVNTTDSAVRITHLPTKIVVQCQNERSQHKNKETCMNMLKARIYEYEKKLKEKKISEEELKKTDIGWGHQIRSYVLQPYQLVKDLRNSLENTNPESVLNGNIDQFLEAAVYELKNNKDD